MASQNFSIVAELQARVDGFINGFRRAQQSADDFVSRNQKTFDSFKQVGAAATAGGVAIAAGLGGAVKIAADFEAQMSVVGAISGATGKDLEALSEKAQEMGANTKFSATQSAEAFEALARMGWSTTQMIDGVSGVMALASAGGVELADAANITASSLAMFGMEAEESARVADVLAAVASNTGTDVLNMGESLKYVGPSANAAGMAIEETAAFIGLLADNSILGSSAGTTMNAMLRDMKNKSEDGAIAIGDTAVAIYDADGKMRGFSDIIADVEKATDGMSDAQRDAALMAIFGDEAMRGLNVALGSGSEELKRIEADMRNAEGTAESMSAAMEDNLNGAVTSLSSALEGAAISIGNALIPYIRKLAEFLKSLVDKFNALDDKTKTTMAIIAALASGFLLLTGPILMFIGFIPSILSGFAALSTVASKIFKVFTNLKGTIARLIPVIASISAPVWIVIGVITALVTAGVLLYKNWDTIKAKLQPLMPLFEFLKGVVKDVWQSFKEAGNVIKTNFNPVLDAVIGLIKRFKPVAEALVEVLKKIGLIVGGTLVVAFGLITSAVKAAISALQPLVDAFINVIDIASTLVDAVVKLFKGDFKGAFESLKDIGKLVEDLFTNILKAVVEFGVTFAKEVAGFFTGAFKSLGGKKIIPQGVFDFIDSVKDAWNGMVKWFDGAIKNFTNFFSDIWKGIGNLATDMWGEVKDSWNAMTSWFGGKKDGFVSFFSNMWKSVGETSSNIWSKVKETFDAIIDIVKPIFNSLKDFISDTWKSIETIAGAAWVIIKNVILGPILLLIDLVKGDMESFSSHFEAIWTNIKESLALIWESIVDVVRSYLVVLETVVDVGMEFVKTVIDTAWSFIRTIWETVLETIIGQTATNFESIRDNVSIVMDAIKQTIDTIWYFIKETFLNVIAFIRELVTGDFEGMKNVIDGQMELIKETIDFIWSDIKEIFTNVITIIKQLVTDKFDEIKDNITQKLEDSKKAANEKWEDIKKQFFAALHNIKNSVTDNFNRIKEDITQKLSDSKQAVIDAWEAMKKNFTDAIENIKTTVKNKFTEMVSSVKEKMDETERKIEDAWNSAVKFLKEIDLLQIGKDIISGLIKGITSKVEDVKNAVKDVASSITQKVTSILQIKSPSRVMMRYGGDTVEGLAIGIKDAAHMAEKASENLGFGVESAFDPQLAMDNFDIARQVDSINRQANRQMESHLTSEINVGRQPAIINVHVGSKQIASEIVDDISQLQDRSANRRKRTPRRQEALYV